MNKLSMKVFLAILVCAGIFFVLNLYNNGSVSALDKKRL